MHTHRGGGGVQPSINSIAFNRKFVSLLVINNKSILKFNIIFYIFNINNKKLFSTIVMKQFFVASRPDVFVNINSI